MNKEKLIETKNLKEHIMRLNAEPFKLIKNKTKTIEMRLNDLKRQLLEVGDSIRFINRETEEELVTRIINLYKFKDFREMYKQFDKVAIGYGVDDEVSPSHMEMYYDPLDIEKYGTLAIEIKVIDN